MGTLRCGMELLTGLFLRRIIERETSGASTREFDASFSFFLFRRERKEKLLTDDASDSVFLVPTTSLTAWSIRSRTSRTSKSR